MTSGVRGTMIDAPVRGEIRFRRDALVVFDDAGTISSVLEPPSREYNNATGELRHAGKLTELADHQYLLPGLIDLHIHAPQWPQMGKALDVSLAEWLNDYTFPLEARYADTDFAAGVYESLVDALLANGTTTAMYFATIHRDATKLLADICLRAGQRALVGRVAMDSATGCPDYYRDPSAAIAIAETSDLISYIQQMDGNAGGLVLPVVTPRFIPSCTDELLAGLGALVADTGCHVQTHCSESDWAHGYGLERFGATDTATYNDMGLLTRRTVLAHSNFIDAEDMDMIADVGAAVAHCPLSNVYFANAVFPLRQALDREVHVGLGTDISGGPSPSVFSAARSAVAASRVREDGTDAGVAADLRGQAGSRISALEAFWLATTGGGVALDLPVGVFEPGFWFDALVIDSSVADSDFVVWPDFDSDVDVIEKAVHNVGRQNIVRVWVQGTAVKG